MDGKSAMRGGEAPKGYCHEKLWISESGGERFFIYLVSVEVLSGNMVKTSTCRSFIQTLVKTSTCRSFIQNWVKTSTQKLVQGRSFVLEPNRQSMFIMLKLPIYKIEYMNTFVLTSNIQNTHLFLKRQRTTKQMRLHLGKLSKTFQRILPVKGGGVPPNSVKEKILLFSH